MNTERLPPKLQGKRGFSVVEILVVVAILAILGTLAVPALRRSTESAKAIECLSNLKQLGQATLAYAADNQQLLPPSIIQPSVGGWTFWYMEIRPYLGAPSALLPISPQYPHGRNLDVFYCPAVSYSRAYPHTHYGCNNNVFMNPNPRVLDDVPQTRLLQIPTPSKIVMFSEVLNRDNPDWPEGGWHLPANVARSNPDIWFPHRHGGRVNAVFCDGHAQSIPRSEVVSHFTNYFGDRELWR